ncbi:MAG: DUF5606 domain-containing protein [Cytophagaceae bacterium]|nr:DUF5606 domain-containing protein [Cytophagaceae bacterium]
MKLLKEIANIAGKPGLYRVLKPTRTGVIVESLDEKRQRWVINKTTRISILSDISLYSELGSDKTYALRSVFTAIRKQHGPQVTLDPKIATEDELAEFLVKIAPKYDRERVHTNDIRKVIAWYNIVSAHLPEAFDKPERETTKNLKKAAGPADETPVKKSRKSAASSQEAEVTSNE